VAHFLSKAESLRSLYAEIHAWASAGDAELVPRRLVERAANSEVIVIGQALALGTQRLSGFPYMLPSGRLSGGGKNLDRFLQPFGYTIDPNRPEHYAYSTDLVPRFPGRNAKGTGDLKPTPSEIAQCASWIEQEIQVVAPTVVVTLGALPSRSFLSRYGKAPSTKLEDMVGRAWGCEVASMRVDAFAVYHPSGAWRFPHKAPQAFEFASGAISSLLSARA
jgi:uracil-DNA glycosylase family 4